MRSAVNVNRQDLVPVPPYETFLAPGRGRIFRSARRVRISDVDERGRLRFDALARYLQDVAADDTIDAGVADAVAWVVRRTTVTASRRPLLGQDLDLRTWCSGTGAAWAERRTTIEGAGGVRVEAVALWVSLDRLSMKPTPVAENFFAPYRESAAGRKVSGRLVLPVPLIGAGPGRLWPTRWADTDVLSHVNNAVAWAAVEEEARRHAAGGHLDWGTVEYRQPIEAGEVIEVMSERDDGTISVWLTREDASVLVSARLGTTAVS